MDETRVAPVFLVGESIPFITRLFEEIKPPDDITDGITYVGATPTPSGDTYDYDQD